MFQRALVVAMFISSVHMADAQLTVYSEPVAAVDNIPPAPVADLQALVAMDAGGRSVELTWSLSSDDALSFQASVGGTVVLLGDVRGYRVYRTDEGGNELLLATLSSGISEYVDSTVEDGQSYIYSVRSFDLDNETEIDAVAGSDADMARIVLVGGTTQVVVEMTIKASMRIESELDLEDEEAVSVFTAQFIERMATLLGISPERIIVTELVAGSVIVSFEIVEPNSSNIDEFSATTALETLKSEVAQGTVAFNLLGKVLSLEDNSISKLVPVIAPLDRNGDPILGWFTREGDQVDFDDFFLFADHFGTEQGQLGYDARFDIVANGRIDFGDFFRFADDFGKVVANASVISGS